MLISRRILMMTALAGGLLLTANAPARADFRVEYGGAVADGANFNHTYNLRFDNTEFELRDGDFATIYDIAGFVSATAPTGFEVVEPMQNLGIDAFGTGLPDGSHDDPMVPNITFRRTGGTVESNDVFVATIVSTFEGTTLGFYSAEETNALGATAGTKKGNFGFVSVPVVPEPISMALLGIGGAVAFGIFRRRHNAIQA